MSDNELLLELLRARRPSAVANILVAALAFAIIGGTLAGAYLVLRPAVADAPAAPALMSDRNPRGSALDTVRQVLTQRYAERQDAAPPPAQNAPVSPNVDAMSAPAPVVSEQQAEQLNFAAELAAQEAAQQYLDQRRAAEQAAPVKMDAAQAEQAYGRDPCHAPRADPHTCALGIPEATPLNQP